MQTAGTRCAGKASSAKGLGVVPTRTVLPPANPGVPAWSDLGQAERRLCERQIEVYAGFLSHTDHQIGRLWRRCAGKGPFTTP